MKSLIPAYLFACSSLALIAGCGGGGSNAPAADLSVSGTAAVGHPVVNATVSLKCASGATASTSTAANGTWSASLPADSAPCLVRVAGGTADGSPLGTPLHSVVLASGTVNVTPLTDLIVAKLAGQDPSTWFNGPSSQLSSVNRSRVDAAATVVQSVLSSLPGRPSLPPGFNPISSPFKADQVHPGDVLLEDYAAALLMAGLTQADAIAEMAAGASRLTLDEPQALDVYSSTTSDSDALELTGTWARSVLNEVLLVIRDTRLTVVNKVFRAAVADGDGSTSGVQSDAAFNGYLSVLQNRVGQICVSGTEDLNAGDGRKADFVFVSLELTELPSLDDIPGGTEFTQYVACRDRGIVLRDVGTSGYTSEYIDPDPLALSNPISMIWTGNLQKAYRLNSGGATVYVLVYNVVDGSTSSIRLAVSR
jgi:hypothetical protein